MTLANNEEKRIIFSENIFEVLSEILQKYKLDETTDDFLKKLENDRSFSGEIVMDLVKKIIKKEATEDALPSLLQKDFNVSDEVAKSLADDIKKDILPSASEVAETEIDEEGEEEPNLKELEQPITVKPTRLIEENPSTANEELSIVQPKKIMPLEKEVNPTSLKYKLKKTKNFENTEKKEAEKQQDSYREPIE